MAFSLWTNAGKLVVNASPAAVWCATCPCEAVTLCCGATASTPGPPSPGSLPTTLYLTISGSGCVDGTYQLVFLNPAAPYLLHGTTQTGDWASAEFACGYNSYFFHLYCSLTAGSGFFTLQMDTKLAGGGYTGLNARPPAEVPTSCGPFAVGGTGAAWDAGTACCGTTQPFNWSVGP